ncbi:MAG: PelD GGDEF domain-containing protein [Fibrobacteria bacterium]
MFLDSGWKGLLTGGQGGSGLQTASRGVTLRSMAETLVLGVAAVALCLWLRPRDAFFLEGRFPWPWLVPIFLALRYGSNSAILSSLILLAGWKAARLLHYPLPEAFPKGYFLGGFIAALSCGEFRDLWHSQIRREKTVREHLERRLASLVGAHQTLAQSHERLVADFLTHPPTLRDALAELPAAPGTGVAGATGGTGATGEKGRGADLDSESAHALLILLARFFQIETASLHAVTGGFLRPEPLAYLGPRRELPGRDSMVAASLATGKLCHALIPQSGDGEDPEGGQGAPGPYLVVAPMAPGGSAPVALLLVERMPFFAFQAENLRSLFAVLGYYADRLRTSSVAAPVLSRFPDCPEDFAAEYMRLHRVQAEAGPESALAALIIPGLPGNSLPEGWDAGLRTAGRSADLYWIRPGKERRLLLIALLPFCGETQARIFLTRLPGSSEAEKLVATLTPGDPIRGLEEFLSRCGLPSMPVGAAAIAAGAYAQHPVRTEGA